MSEFHVRDRVIRPSLQLCLPVRIREELIEEPFCLNTQVDLILPWYPPFTDGKSLTDSK